LHNKEKDKMKNLVLALALFGIGGCNRAMDLLGMSDDMVVAADMSVMEMSAQEDLSHAADLSPVLDMSQEPDMSFTFSEDAVSLPDMSTSTSTCNHRVNHKRHKHH
jgi:hypothetical protein